MILGLDISTSITGYTVVDLEGKILRCDAWDMRNKKKFENHFDKAQFLKDELCFLKAQYPINQIYIETSRKQRQWPMTGDDIVRIHSNNFQIINRNFS